MSNVTRFGTRENKVMAEACTWHRLKVDPEPFAAMWEARKKADLRDLSDRTISEGDKVVFEEFDRKARYFTGRSIHTKITHIQRGYILPEPHGAMLSFKVIKRYHGDNRFESQEARNAMADIIPPCCGFNWRENHATIGMGADRCYHRKGCPNGPGTK